MNKALTNAPAIDSPAMRNLRTVYTSTVIDGDDLQRFDVLKNGKHSSKIGGRVMIGRWLGMPIYTLTLEERATCPVSCRHLRSCYGNHMHLAHRFAATPAFERKLVHEVLTLGRTHVDGFVVRLHVLGDFYSVEYVRLWRVLLDEVPQLRVFGYTSRWGDPIGSELRSLVAERWDRFAVRFSNAPTYFTDGELDKYLPATMLAPATISIELPVQRPQDAFICPVQLNRSESCATCAACWSTKKRVAFIQH